MQVEENCSHANSSNQNIPEDQFKNTISDHRSEAQVDDSDHDEPGTAGAGSYSDTDTACNGSYSDMMTVHPSIDDEPDAAGAGSYSDTMTVHPPIDDDDHESDTAGGGGSNMRLSEASDNDEIGDTSTCTASRPLYPGASITEQQATLALLLVSSKHNMTEACVADVSELLSQLLPKPNVFATSSRILLRRYVAFEDVTIKHHCCGHCMKLLPDSGVCTSHSCIEANKPNPYFLELPIEVQVQEHLNDPSFVDALRYRFTKSHALGVLTDIYDGTVYQSKSTHLDDRSLTLSLNFDGAPRFKSSGMQVWPVQLIVNELPPKMRFATQNILLAGLWCATDKPPTFSYFEPILTKFKKLSSDGMEVTIPHVGRVTYKLDILFSTCDLPAKASLLNTNQYNGKYGCSHCLHPGQQVKQGKGSAKVYGYGEHELRSHSNHMEHAKKALDSGTVVFGVKGYSAFHILPTFDTVKSVPVDYMHCILLGVTKKLVALWLDTKYSRQPWYIGTKLETIDERLCEIKPPNCLSRLPRGLKDRKFWKAKEWQFLLVYYLPVVTRDLLPQKYYHHALLLTTAVRILLAEEIILPTLREATNMLDTFYRLYQEYYGLSNCTHNVHLLSHVTEHVAMYGPLWTHSAFPFENFMGNLLRDSHATHNIAKQMAVNFILRKRLHTQLEQTPSEPIELHQFLNRMDRGSSCKKHEASSHILNDCLTALGKINYGNVADVRELAALSQISATVTVDDPVMQYRKIRANGFLVYTQDIPRVQRTNNYTVAYYNSNSGQEKVEYGYVRRLLTVQDNHYAIICPLEVHPAKLCQGEIDEGIMPFKNTMESHFLSFNVTNELEAIPTKNILATLCNIKTSTASIFTTLLLRGNQA